MPIKKLMTRGKEKMQYIHLMKISYAPTILKELGILGFLIIVIPLIKVRTRNFWYTKYMDEGYQYFNSLMLHIGGTRDLWNPFLGTMIGWMVESVTSLHIHSEPLKRGQVGGQKGGRKIYFFFHQGCLKNLSTP